MRNSTLPLLAFAISAALSWFLYRIGGENWVFVYAAGFGPILMAFAAVWDQQRS